MHRDLDGLTARTFDVLVVGGGIYGLTIAYDSAQRGLSVALIERHDFGSGASFNHLRTIHGGLRYLQTLDLSRARESVNERRTIARIAPGAVRPLAFHPPAAAVAHPGHARDASRVSARSVVSRHRNDDVPTRHLLPPGTLCRRHGALDGFGAWPKPPARAAVWYDYVTTDADRLTLSWGIAAANHGAVLANYLEATELIVEGGRAIGVRAADRLANRKMEIARSLVDQRHRRRRGPVAGRFRARGWRPDAEGDESRDHSKGSRPRASEVEGRPGGRCSWCRGRGGRCSAPGNRHDPARPTIRRSTHSEVRSFIDEISYAFPSVSLTAQDVTLVHRGVVPAVIRADGRAVLEGHEQVRDHADRGVEGLITVAGTKYTTARAVAERVTNRILSKLGQGPVPCRTAETPLPFSHGDDRRPAGARRTRRNGDDARGCRRAPHSAWRPRPPRPGRVGTRRRGRRRHVGLGRAAPPCRNRRARAVLRHVERVEDVGKTGRESNRRIEAGQPEKQRRIKPNRAPRVSCTDIQEAARFGAGEGDIPGRHATDDLGHHFGLVGHRSRDGQPIE